MYKIIFGEMCSLHELLHLYSLDKSSCNSSVVISEQYSVFYRHWYGSERYHASVFSINCGVDLKVQGQFLKYIRVLITLIYDTS